MSQVQIDIPLAEIEAFCKQNHIRKLALFGSVLRRDFTQDSDVDVLVKFEPGKVPGLIRLGGMAEELSSLLGGRRVDLLTPEDLSEYFREDVINSAEVLYGAD